MDAKVRRFAIRGIGLLVVFLAVYPFLMPGYRSVVLGGSGFLLELLRPPMSVDEQIDGTWRVVVPATGSRPGWTFFLDSQEFGQAVAFLGLAILPALVLATPVGIRVRLRLLLIALACLFVVNMLSVTMLIYILGTHCYGREGERTCSLIAGSLSSWSHIMTFGLWGLITWRYWFNGSKEIKRAASPGRRR